MTTLTLLEHNALAGVARILVGLRTVSSHTFIGPPSVAGYVAEGLVAVAGSGAGVGDGGLPTHTADAI